jgi:hypothetical protein
MSLQNLDERVIAPRKRLFEYVIEIAGRLMRVDDKNQMEAWGHGG